MINKIFFPILIVFSLSVSAQIKGLTETGEEVILFQDGTWKYLNDDLNKEIEITKNNEVFIKDDESSFLVKSAKTNVGIWINPKQWSFSKADSSSPAEFKFNNKDIDIYAMLIAEKLEITNESLAEIAFNNANEAAQNVKIIKKEYRKVNDIDLIMMQMSGSIKGVNFVYFGYYYSGTEGAFQLLAYAAENQFNQSKDIMEKFLNGFVRL